MTTLQVFDATCMKASGALKLLNKYPTGKGANWVEIVIFESDCDRAIPTVLLFTWCNPLTAQGPLPTKAVLPTVLDSLGATRPRRSYRCGGRLICGASRAYHG